MAMSPRNAARIGIPGRIVEPPYCNKAGHDEITRLRAIERELNDLKEGRTILLPIDRAHAEKMVLVGEAFLKPQS